MYQQGYSGSSRSPARIPVSSALPAILCGMGLSVLAAAARRDRRCRFQRSAWMLIGLYPRGRLLAPPADTPIPGRRHASGFVSPRPPLSGIVTITAPARRSPRQYYHRPNPRPHRKDGVIVIFSTGQQL